MVSDEEFIDIRRTKLTFFSEFHAKFHITILQPVLIFTIMLGPTDGHPTLQVVAQVPSRNQRGEESATHSTRGEESRGKTRNGEGE